jgi:ribosomal protein L19E
LQAWGKEKKEVQIKKKKRGGGRRGGRGVMKARSPGRLMWIDYMHSLFPSLNIYSSPKYMSSTSNTKDVCTA